MDPSNEAGASAGCGDYPCGQFTGCRDGVMYTYDSGFVCSVAACAGSYLEHREVCRFGCDGTTHRCATAGSTGGTGGAGGVSGAGAGAGGG